MTPPVTEQRLSARRALLFGFGGLALLVGGLIGWGVFASVSGAVIATGRVVVETRNQVVEHIDGGTIGEILVRDGDTVAPDDVLLRFSDGALRSQAALLEGQYAELAARRNRLEAEFQGADVIVWDAALEVLAANDASVQDILDSQDRLFRARRAARDGEVARLRQRIGQAREEITGLEAQAAALKEQSRLIGRELAAHRELSERGLTRLERLLALERAAKNLEGVAGTTAAAIARVRGRIAEFEIQILQVDARRVEEAEAKARDTRALENQVMEQLAALRDRLGRMEVRAPVGGEVFGMAVFAPREVVRPGEPILQIVPADASLVVMARLDPIHVDQVYPGQEARLRFSAFPARLTPEFEGRVARVSADAVRDTDNRLSWYEVELAIGARVEPGAAGALGTGALALAPGMPVEVYIRAGERSLLSYLAKPLTDFFGRSLREE